MSASATILTATMETAVSDANHQPGEGQDEPLTGACNRSLAWKPSSPPSC